MPASVAVLSLRIGAFPRWLGWLAVATAMAYLVLSLGIVFFGGPLAPSGALTYVLYLTFLVWLVPATVVMMRRLGASVLDRAVAEAGSGRT